MAHSMETLHTLRQALIQAISDSGFYVAGPTDWRAAENGEPRWVCNARAALAQSLNELMGDPDEHDDQ
jgi:hypothetical protein